MLYYNIKKASQMPRLNLLMLLTKTSTLEELANSLYV